MEERRTVRPTNTEKPRVDVERSAPSGQRTVAADYFLDNFEILRSSFLIRLNLFHTMGGTVLAGPVAGLSLLCNPKSMSSGFWSDSPHSFFVVGERNCRRYPASN